MIGKYASQGIPYSFEFRFDSTYRYQYRSFHSFRYSLGRWSATKAGDIILNSYNQEVFLNGNITMMADTVNNQKNILHFLFTSASEIRNFKCEIIINDTVYDKLLDRMLFPSNPQNKKLGLLQDIGNLWGSYFRCDTLNILKSIKVGTPIKTVQLRFLYDPIEPSTNLFTNNTILAKEFISKKDFGELKFNFTLTDSIFFYQPFKNEKLKVKRNKVGIFQNKKWRFIPKISNNKKIFLPTEQP